MSLLLADLTPADLVIVLLSGGGSALLPAPAEGLRLQDLQETTDLLLACGADITEVKAVRKHCSRWAGGQLARVASPARVAALVLSDVVGSPLDAIASGPTAPDPTTFSDARAVLTQHRLEDKVPSPVWARIEAGCRGAIADTAKPEDPLFERVHNVIVGDNECAARAAGAEARRQGWNALYLGSRMEGEAREVGRVMAGLGLSLAWGEADFPLPACLILGGETTVTLQGRGKGGRNQELALAAALALDRARKPANVHIAVLSFATDGNDGPTDAAGAIATGETLVRARRLGLDARAALAATDSAPFWSALGDLVLTGPTNTNVNDLVFVLAWPKQEDSLAPNGEPGGSRARGTSRGRREGSPIARRSPAARTGSKPAGLIFTDLDGTLLDHETYDFTLAVDALRAAQDASVLVILCSSKTRPELLAWQERLGLAQPFVSENGGAVFYAGEGPLRSRFRGRFDGMPAKVFGTPYPVLRKSLEDLRERFDLPVRGFGDMELDEIMQVTGLSAEDARRAGRRDFDEPFLWLDEPDEEHLESVRRWLSEQRLQVIRGGRLWHLVGGNDKGGAVRWVLDACAAAYAARLPSLGLGDSENDLPMLHAVDRGVLVERHGGGHLQGAHRNIVRVPGVGPEGWARAVEDWLREMSV
jgi:hydroxypyruvate reductase